MEITVADLSGKHCNSAIQHHCHFLTSGQKISKSLFVPYYEVMSIYNFMSHSLNSACQKIHFDFFFFFFKYKPHIFLLCLSGIQNHRLHWDLCCSERIMQKESICVLGGGWGEVSSSMFQA